jgi:hypothetical protein
MKYRIEPDSDPSSPRKDFDNLGVMVCFHHTCRCDLGDKHDLRSDLFSGWEAVEKHLREELGAVIVLPLYLMDHSGITMSTDSSGFRACDAQGWDWGQVGFIYVTREALLKEYSKKRLTQRTIEKATGVLVREVEVYDTYLRGDVWGYIIEDDAGNYIDSCWGMYGHEYAEEEAKLAMKENA